MWWTDHMNGWAWFWMIPMTFAFRAVLAWATVALVRGGRASPASPSAAGRDPEDMLAEWLARGEIDPGDYSERLEALRRSRPPVRSQQTLPALTGPPVMAG